MSRLAASSVTPTISGAMSPALYERVVAAQVDMLYARNFLPAAFGVAFAAFIVSLFWSELPHRMALGWLAIKATTVLVRLALGWAYAKKKDAASPSRWAHMYMVSLGLDGLAWTLMGLWFTPQDNNFILLGVLLGSLIGAAAVGNVALSMHFGANLTYTTTLLCPTAIYQGLQGGKIGAFWFCALLLLAFLVLVDGRRAALDTLDLLRLRFENDTIARQRADALALAHQHSEAKSQFLSIVSHEMRTPLHGILGMLRLLREAMTLPEQRKTVDTIRSSGEHLLGVINDILDFSSIEAGRLTVRDEGFELTAVLAEVLEFFAATAAESSLRLDFDSRLPRPCWMRGDAARVRQIMLNLVGNAIKFTAQGEVRVSAELAADRVRLAVSDTGPGIAGEDLSMIFEGFRQADSSFARRYSGTGLGLAISRNLAQAMGGELHCESRPGEGSTFILELPYRSAAPSPARVATGKPPRLRGRVLLAEDNGVNVAVARAALERLGVSVEVAANGEEAHRRYLAVRPDLVLMDCHMPLIDGFEASRRIRQTEQQAQAERIPIIAVTASVDRGQRERCAAAGMDGLLAKPFSNEELAELLARYLPAVDVVPPTVDAAPPAAHEEPLLPALCDRAAAIQRLGSDVTLYASILAGFFNDQRDAAVRTRADLESGRLEDALRRAHTLTGLAGTIGATALQQVSRRLTELLRQKDTSPATLQALDETERELERVIREVAP